MLIDELQATIKPTAQERAVIDFIVQNPTFIETCTARELAQASLTSAPTVTRLCQKLGFNGFADFRLRFVSEQRASRKNLYTDLSRALFQTGSSVDETHRLLPQLYNTIVYETNAHVTSEKIAQLKDLVRSARHIDLYATGINRHIAEQAAFNFQSVGIACNVYDEAIVPLVERLSPSDRHLSFLLSHTGANAKIVEIARILAQRRLAVAAITENAASPLAELADVTIELFAAPKPNRLYLMAYTISLRYLFDLLYTALLADEFDEMLPESPREFYAALNQ